MYLGSDEHKLNMEKARLKSLTFKCNCQFCNTEITKGNLKRHESFCHLNPKNKKECIVCGSLIKNYKTSTTCSYSCSNTFFRSGKNHGNWKEHAYRSTCFEHHKKECVICQEQNIIEVHHLDENKNNNHPSNLIPLCPTHHQYWHSRYKHLIEHKVIEYIKKWSGKQDSNLCAPTSKDGGNGQTSPFPDR